MLEKPFIYFRFSVLIVKPISRPITEYLVRFGSVLTNSVRLRIRFDFGFGFRLSVIVDITRSMNTPNLYDGYDDVVSDLTEEQLAFLMRSISLFEGRLDARLCLVSL
jgi:hypothetical protein